MEEKEKTWLRELAHRVLNPATEALSLEILGNFWKTNLSPKRKKVLSDVLKKAAGE